MLYAGFLLGFIGSFHCVGMCGPIALSLPFPAGGWQQRLFGHLIYQSGKILAYSTLGALAGALGQTISWLGLQSRYAVILGAMLIVGALGFKLLHAKRTTWMTGLQKLLGKWLFRQSYPSLFTIGLLNGILPCGLVYLGLAGASAVGTWTGGVAYMVLFGLGVLPSLLILSIAGHFATANMRRWFNKAYPFAAIALGIMLIYRGLYFQQQVDYIKTTDPTATQAPMCH